MSSVGERIREAAEKIGGLNKLADTLTDVSRRTLSDYVSGKSEPRISTLIEIAESTSSDLNWILAADHLAGGVDGAYGGFSSQRQVGYVSAETVILPRYDVRASAGAGSLVVAEDVSEHFAVGRSWLQRNLPIWAAPNAQVGILENGGDSMEPTIRDGDLLMVVQGVEWRTVERGGIFIFSYDDRLLLKRLQVLETGDVKVISDNTAYEPWIIKYDDREFRIIVHGQVFFAGGKPRSF